MQRDANEVFAELRSIRDNFLAVLDEFGTDKAEQNVDGEGWTIAQTAMHVATVESGIIRICAKLLGNAEAEGSPSDGGKITLSDDFLRHAEDIKTEKLDAPERVQPTADVRLKDAVSAVNANADMLDALLPKFIEFDSAAGTFPHPYLGGLTAAEWLSLSGDHIVRHLKQIDRIGSKLT